MKSKQRKIIFDRKDDGNKDIVQISKKELEEVVGKKAVEKAEKLFGEKKEEFIKELQEKHKKEFEELQKKQDEKIKEAVEKAEANRKSVEDLGELLTGEKASDEQILMSKLEKSEKISGDKETDFDKDFKRAHDRLSILDYVMRVRAGKSLETVKATRTYKEYINLYKRIHKAFDEGAGTGLEWMPQVLSSRLIEYVEASPDFTIVDLFERITMLSSTFKIPREDGVVTVYKGSIGGTPTESSAATGNAQFDAEKIIGYTKLFYEAEEDMIISAMPLIEKRLTKALAKGISDAIVNGDDSTTHMDANVTSATDRRKLWKGLRKLCQRASFTYNVAGAWTQEKLRKFENFLDIAFGMAFDDLAFIFGKDSYNQIRNLAEVRTVEKAGVNVATILKGRLQDIDAIGVNATSLVSDAVSANGVVSATAASNTKGQALLVYKPGFAYGSKRTLLLETDKNIITQHIDVVASMRGDFQPLIKFEDSTAQKFACQARNITPW